MTIAGADEIRAVVREVLREALPGLVGGPRRVRVSDTADLNALVQSVIEMLDDPVTGPRLRRGELTFELLGGAADIGPDPVLPSEGSASDIVVEHGVITERVVTRAVREKARIIAGAKVVITPLAREQIRRAKVEVQRR